MNPVIFSLGPLTVRWYGLFMALALIAGFLLISRRTSRFGLRPEQVGDLLFMAIVAGLLGARLFYVVQHWPEYLDNPGQIIRIDRGGLVFFGGFVGATLAGFAFCRVRRWRFAEILDLCIPALPLGHALGRVGCFLNGCCFGRPSASRLAVTYPAAAYPEVLQAQIAQGLLPAGASQPLPVFPVQLLAALLNLAICLFLLKVERRLKRRGQLFALYLIAYSLTRFSVEFARGDHLHQFIGLTPAQTTAIVVLPIGLAWFLILQPRIQDR